MESYVNLSPLSTGRTTFSPIAPSQTFLSYLRAFLSKEEILIILLIVQGDGEVLTHLSVSEDGKGSRVKLNRKKWL